MGRLDVVVLKLEKASESPRRRANTRMAGPQLQRL